MNRPPVMEAQLHGEISCDDVSEYGNTPSRGDFTITIVSTLLTNQGAASGRVCGPGGGASEQKNRDFTKECAKATISTEATGKNQRKRKPPMRFSPELDLPFIRASSHVCKQKLDSNIPMYPMHSAIIATTYGQLPHYFAVYSGYKLQYSRVFHQFIISAEASSGVPYG